MTFPSHANPATKTANYSFIPKLPKNAKTHPRCSMFAIGKWFLLIYLVVGVLAAENQAAAQASDSNLPDAPSEVSLHPVHSDDPASERTVTWRSLPKDFLHDQKGIWLFPAQLAKGKHWIPTVTITGVTAGLIVADPHAMPYFGNHARNIDDINDVFDSSISAAEIVILPASLLAVGYARHDDYQKGTALLAGEAYADASVVDLVMKAITRRKRPSDVLPGGSYNDTFFSGSKSPFKGSSFPSGHAVGAFSVATIVANRYHNHRWAPFLLYGFATAVSFSRVTTRAHFPSDVFLGAALGYTIAKYQVLSPR